MADQTRENLYATFAGESKAYFRLLAFAEKAEAEDLGRIALLFRAVAEAERVHASKSLRLLREFFVKDTQENLEASFEREQVAAGERYPEFIRVAEAEGNQPAAVAFSHMRDAEERHATLYKHALQFMLAADDPQYFVCPVCGYIAEGAAPETCPVCGVSGEQFRRVT